MLTLGIAAPEGIEDARVCMLNKSLSEFHFAISAVRALGKQLRRSLRLNFGTLTFGKPSNHISQAKQPSWRTGKSLRGPFL